MIKIHRPVRMALSTISARHILAVSQKTAETLSLSPRIDAAASKMFFLILLIVFLRKFTLTRLAI
jgi:hypothetical protein